MDWWLVLIIIVICFIVVFILLYLLKLYLRRAKFNKSTKITDKIVLITGANTGIGKETAIDLAKRGGKIYLACRDAKRGEDAVIDIKSESGNDNIFFMQLDLGSLESIREFSQRFHQLEYQLNILINNAGVMACPKSYTSDGFEMHMGVNHLGHFLLTNLLLDLLKAGAPSRIVVVSSDAYKFSNLNRNDLMSELSYNKYKAYSQSKLANIMFANELANRLEGTNVTVNSCHPGVVQTELGRYMNENVRKYIIRPIFSPFMKTPKEGAQTSIMLAVDPDLEKSSGKYFTNCRETKLLRAARDSENASWLFEHSAKLVGFQ